MSQKITHATEATNLADILERILDKGIVIAGDVRVKIADIELLSIQIRLVICSVDKAQELGINWWKNDNFLSGDSKIQELTDTNQLLLNKIADLEKQLDTSKS